MAKLGEDVIEWQTDQLVQWLKQEGMNDCIRPFASRKMNGRSLVNLSEPEIKSLHHVSHESKKKLIKSIERFKRKKKERMAAMFGDQQHVTTRKPPSFCQEDDAGSDDDGWGSEEWDSDGSQEDASSEGEYLEPEEDLSKTGSLGREAVSSVPSGLVAQLRAGIASSLSRTHQAAAPQQNYQDDEDIYDVPPEEEDEELYDEPSDSSGGAVVVRPPKKPPKLEGKGEYLQPREMDGDQDLYEAPLEEEEESPSPPARPSKANKFISTKVFQGNKFVPVNNNENEVYEIPDLEEPEEEDSYEIPGEQARPPPRPPKGSSAPTLSAKLSKPFSAQKPHVSPAKSPFRGPPPQPGGQPQGAPNRFPAPNTRPQQSSLSPQGTPFRPQPQPPAKTNFQPPIGRKPPPEQKKPEFPPKNTAPPMNHGGHGRIPGGQAKSPPVSPVKSVGGGTTPGPGQNLRPVPGPRGGMLNKMEPPPRAAAKEEPSPSSRGPALPPPIHRKQEPLPLPTERPPLPEPKATPVVEPVSSSHSLRGLPTVPQKTEPVPPRPPKAGHPKSGQPGGNQQPTLPPRQGVPLPTPPQSTHRDQKEQSSASSIESTSADEPIIPLQHLSKPPGKRSLPAPPTSESKSSLDLMKEAPWYQGSVDRKAVDTSLKQLNKNGAFLVRNSIKSPNDYSMSLIYDGNVRHLRIPHKNNKYVLGDSGVQKFDSIIDLVNYYRQNELDLKTGGKTTLTIACQVYKS